MILKKNVYISIAVGIVLLLLLAMFSIRPAIQQTSKNTARTAFFGIAKNTKPKGTSATQTPLEKSVYIEQPLTNTLTPSYKNITPPTHQQPQYTSIISLFDSLLKIPKSTKTPPYAHTTDTSLWSGTYTTTSVSTQSPQQATPIQKALRAYGNQLGKVLTTFTMNQGDQIAVLKAFIANKNDTTSIKQLSDAYRKLSETIAALTVPIAQQDINTALAKGYKSVGSLLWDITKATDDTGFVQRLLTYNKASEVVALQQIEIINTFKVYQVTFESYEPGVIFMFGGNTF